MLRLLNRLVHMDESRIPKKILRFDIATGKKGWIGDIIQICHKIDIPSPIGPFQSLMSHDLDAISRRMMKMCRDGGVDAAQEMPKLRTYIQIRDFMDTTAMVRAALPRGQRSILSKFLCGILPLEVELGRYTRNKKVDPEERVCKICNSGQMEDELHFMFRCSELQVVRNETVSVMLLECVSDDEEEISEVEKLRWMLQENRLKQTAEIIEKLYYARQDLVYKLNTNQEEDDDPS